MSDPRIKGPLSAVVLPVSDSLQQLGASPPFQKHVSLACTGAILLTLCAFAALVFGRDVATFSTETLLGFAAVVGVGLLLLVVGMRGARGPRDPTMAISSVATPAGVAAVLWWLWGPEVFSNVFVVVLGPAFLVGFALRFWLAVRGPGGGAQRMVRQHIEQDRIEWRSARRK